jgi:hypothetical protein
MVKEVARFGDTCDRCVSERTRFARDCENRETRPAAREYTGHMTTESSDATIRLGELLSVFAAVVAVVLTLAGDVSKWSLVVSVLIVGSIASWIQSGITMHEARDDTQV